VSWGFVCIGRGALGRDLEPLKCCLETKGMKGRISNNRLVNKSGVPRGTCEALKGHNYNPSTSAPAGQAV